MGVRKSGRSKVSRNARVLEMILQRAGRKVSETRLLKLAYMADLLAWRVLGGPISEFRYIRWRRGPFSEKFYRAKEELVDQDFAKEEEITTSAEVDCTLISSTTKRELHPEDFTPGQIHLIDLVIGKYGKVDLGTFLKEVYETSPMKAASHGELLPMKAEKNTMRDAAGGISLETILQSEKEFERGEFVTLEELKKEILGA